MNDFFNKLLMSEKISTPADIEHILLSLSPYMDTVKKWDAREKKSIEYYNIPAAFDIENTSFYENGEKRGCMYAWMLGIYGIAILGRTWTEFINTFNAISDILELSDKRRLIVYVHFLGHDFSYFNHYMKWENVFCIQSLKPLYALNDRGIEFRCSYMLSGYKLETVGNNLNTYKINKQVGLLNYNLKRHSATPLAEQEKKYCIYDVKVLNAYIMECIEQSGDITKIPLTKTGYVREYCRNACFYAPGESRKKSKKKRKYTDMMAGMVITSAEEYRAMKRSFQGGFVHGNILHIGEILTDALSMDLCSSYPAAMLSEQYPMTSGELIEDITREELKKSLDLYCCILDIEFYNIRPKIHYDNYISVSKCWRKEKTKINNGRLVSADMIGITITNIDFEIINKFYTWDGIKVLRLWRYKKGYLPKDFILSILDLYEKKTTLKGIPEKIIEYAGIKEMLNAAFGMAVQDPLNSDITFDDGDYFDNEDEIRHSDEEIQARIDKYNTSKNRFLFYPWGIFVTAYARRNIISAVLAIGEDYIYSDTDSVKFLHPEKHKQFFIDYNKSIVKKIAHCLDYYGIDKARLMPKTITGKNKPLGVFEIDGNYKTLKVLRSKCYLYEDEKGHIALTASGLSKEKTRDYIVHKYKNRVFEKFADGLEIRPDRTGKMTHTYINKEIQGTIRDYLGNEGEYHELSFTHLEPAPYVLGYTSEFTQFIYEMQSKRLK